MCCIGMGFTERLCNPDSWRSSKQQDWVLGNTIWLWKKPWSEWGPRLEPCHVPVPPEAFCDRYTVNTTEATHATWTLLLMFHAVSSLPLWALFIQAFLSLWHMSFLWSLHSAKLDLLCLHQASTHCKALCNNNISWSWFTTIATTQVLGSLRSPISNGFQFSPMLSASPPPPAPASEPGQHRAHAVPVWKP